jgi:hypothetical protein
MRPDAFAIACVRHAPPIHPETCRAEITDLYVSPTRGAAASAARSSRGDALGDRARRRARRGARLAAQPDAQAFWRAQGYGAHMNVLHRRL